MSYINSFPKHIPHKLHLVTLVRSRIGRPHWEKRILTKYGLTKRRKSAILKNTAQVNADLKEVRTLIEIHPIVIDPDEGKPAMNGEQYQEVFTDVEERRVELAKISDKVGDLPLISSSFLDQYGNFDVKAYEKYVEEFPDEQLQEKLSKNHYEGSELYNHDFYMDEEALVTDKGEQIELYFKKDTWNQTNKKSLEKRLFRPAGHKI